MSPFWAFLAGCNAVNTATALVHGDSLMTAIGIFLVWWCFWVGSRPPKAKRRAA